MFTVLFWKDTSERVIATIAGALVALWTIGGTGLLDVDLKASASVAGMAGAISLLKAVVASKLGDDESASLVSSITTIDTNHDDSAAPELPPLIDLSAEDDLDADDSAVDDSVAEAALNALADDNSDPISEITEAATPDPDRVIADGRSPQGDF